jgi:hypothetical protein
MMNICLNPSNLPTHNKWPLVLDNMNAKHFQNFDFNSFTDNTMSVLHSCDARLLITYASIAWYSGGCQYGRINELMNQQNVNSLDIGTLQIDVGNLLQHEVPG